jgi:hypothetical protein
MNQTLFLAIHLALIGSAVAGATPVRAGAEFIAVTRNETSGSRLPSIGNATVRGRVDGDRGRLEYLESGLGSLPKGSIVVTTDGAQSTTLYNVEDHSCGDLPVPGSAATGTRAQAPTQMRYENLTVDKTLDEPGAKVHGAATRHLRYAIAYEAHTGGDSGKSLHGSIASEVWVAPALKDGAFAMWLGAAPRTGNPDADRRIADGMVAAKGAALKRIQRTTLRAEGGKEQTSTTTLEVTRLSPHRPSAKALAPPFACRIVPARE